MPAPVRFRRPTTLDADLEWCTRQLYDDLECWCVRYKGSAGGVVKTFVAAPPGWLAAQEQIAEEPRDRFNVHPIVISPQHGAAMFGPECAWPKGE